MTKSVHQEQIYIFKEKKNTNSLWNSVGKTIKICIEKLKKEKCNKAKNNKNANAIPELLWLCTVSLCTHSFI